MRTFINNENNTKVYIKGLRFGCMMTYPVYDMDFRLITIIDKATLKANYTRVK